MLRAVIMAVLGPAIASAQQTVPVLRYQPPANWYRSEAAQDDPGNSGRYTVSAGQIYMQFGTGQELEEITAPLPRSGSVEIETVVYQRQ